MLALSSALPLLLLHAVTVEPRTVPAEGRHEAVMKLDEPAMVRLSAEHPSGVACEVVDHLRGPFESSGTPGREKCQTDLLLDSGAYKLRLRGPKKAKGSAELRAVAFEELNTDAVRLTPGSEVQRELRSGQQASYWVRVEQRGPVAFRATGRTAGALHVWRNGEWLEGVTAQRYDLAVGEGQLLHEWWVEQVMEPGEYRFTVYGTREHRWTKGKPHDVVSVAFGFPAAPEGRTASITLPAWGLVTMLLPKQPALAVMTMNAAPTESTSLELYSVGADGSTNLGQRTTSSVCVIHAKALVPECAAAAADDSAHVLVVRGMPGTRVELQWAPIAGDLAQHGEYGVGARMTLNFVPQAPGPHYVATHDVPVDYDAPPLTCALERSRIHPGAPVPASEWTMAWDEVARDSLVISRDRPFRRSFNHDGRLTKIAFRLTEALKLRIAIGNERKTRCELWKVGAPKRTRLTGADQKPGKCDVDGRYEPGEYELYLHEGTEGIEKVRIASEDKVEGPDTPTKTACAFANAQLEEGYRYRVLAFRGGAIAARGLVALRHPLAVDAPLPVTVEAGARLKLAFAAGQTLLARSAGGARFSCELAGRTVEARDGRCDLGTGATEVTFGNSGAVPVSIVVQRPSVAPTPAGTASHSPASVALQRVLLEQPLNLDFDRGQQHALSFDVAVPGLYHATTTGLLATSCSIRTPVVLGLGSETSGGRGRNCLVAQYLRPGRYLINVRAEGQSKGRAGVLVTRKSVKRAEKLTADAQTFFRAEAGELLQQTLVMPASADYRIESTALGAPLQCRLDDAEGWPVFPVPTSCSSTFALEQGSYLWTQLPLTVESMRRTQLERVRGAEVLEGDKPHRVQFNTDYAARLGADGKDEFLFDLPAELELRVTLTNGMQARVFRLEEGGPKPVELIPPAESAPAAVEYEEVGESHEESTSSSDGEGEEYEGGGEGEGNDAPPEPGEPEEPRYRTWAPAPVVAGHVIVLPAGRYQLVAEHSRADVAIDYALRIDISTLVPGSRIAITAPARVPLRLPTAGTLRLRTEGQTDVRCRVFDAQGHRLFESAGAGDDWNCALAEPVAPGDYTIVIESETQRPGPTQLSAALLELEDGGTLTHGATVQLAGPVRSFLLPEAGDGVIHDLHLRSTERFSCALEAPTGGLLFRSSDANQCATLARLGKGPWRLRLWTLAPNAKVNVSHWLRKISPLGGRSIPAGEAAVAKIERPGRYTTSGSIFCLREDARGILERCGPQVSLESGGWVFTTFGPSGNAPVPLEELVASTPREEITTTAISPRPFIQRQRSDAAGLHLVEVRVPHGERNAPACEVRGGARDILMDRCVAASGRVTEAELRYSLRSPAPVEASVRRAFVRYPAAARVLAPGVQTLSWEGESARFAVPEQPARVDLLLAADTWAVLLDGNGAAVDLCGPKDRLSRCILGAAGGEVVLFGTNEAFAEANVTVLESAERRVRLSGVHEETPTREGRVRLELPAATTARRLEVNGALRCVLALDDGQRSAGCAADVPAGRSGEVIVEHGASPLRAFVHAEGPAEREKALFGTALTAATRAARGARALGEGRAEKLGGGVWSRAVSLDKEAAVHFRGDAGVCALTTESGALLEVGDGFGRACEIDRVLPPGRYAFTVRQFGAQPLSGLASWTRSEVKPLSEGLAAEDTWIAPGAVRFFRFAVQAQGKVGLGVRVPAETLSCALFDAKQQRLGDGCQQYLPLAPGDYLFSVRAGGESPPQRFRPVVFGLAGSRVGVPDEYLRDFFTRIGTRP